ncbi:uncharacterized protein LOC127749441 [Frankliniella occidentalis]|uniref:Uncharacterized protein LOC127749441 n=1 Tax=Frankliniella occidentalis TaxID=133901 RepID=A0A9C6U4Q1_FRAOC|nr:uncharacterized protein LOC127749441 [Frankliniella occidentalis]
MTVLRYCVNIRIFSSLPGIARKPHSSSYDCPSPNSEELNEDENDSENVQEGPTAPNIEPNISETHGPDYDSDGTPSENIEADMSEAEYFDNDSESPTQNIIDELSQADQKGYEAQKHGFVAQGGLSQTTVQDGSQIGKSGRNTSIQVDIVSIEEWRKQCEICNKYGEDAFNYLDFCETCGSPIHTGEKSCSVPFGTSDDDMWVCLKCSKTPETTWSYSTTLINSFENELLCIYIWKKIVLFRTDLEECSFRITTRRQNFCIRYFYPPFSNNIEIIVIDSDSDYEAECPIKEEFENSNVSNAELNQVFDVLSSSGLIQGNLPGNCEKVAKKPAYKKNWKCFTCGNRDLELRSIKTPGKNFQRKYYGCFSNNQCTSEKPFCFWAPKKDDSSETLVLPKDRGNVTLRSRKRAGAPFRSNSEPVSIGDSAPQGDKRPKRQTKLPVYLRKSYEFNTPRTSLDSP